MTPPIWFGKVRLGEATRGLVIATLLQALVGVVLNLALFTSPNLSIVLYFNLVHHESSMFSASVFILSNLTFHVMMLLFAVHALVSVEMRNHRGFRVFVLCCFFGAFHSLLEVSRQIRIYRNPWQILTIVKLLLIDIAFPIFVGYTANNLGIYLKENSQAGEKKSKGSKKRPGKSKSPTKNHDRHPDKTKSPTKKA